MTRNKWKLTSGGDSGPQIDEWGPGDPRFSPGTPQFSLLHWLSLDPENGMVEVEPGVFTVSKTEFGREV